MCTGERHLPKWREDCGLDGKRRSSVMRPGRDCASPAGSCGVHVALGKEEQVGMEKEEIGCQLSMMLEPFL